MKEEPLKSFRWPNPKNSFDKRAIENIKEYGCQIIAINKDHKYKGPKYAFSVGLYCIYQHPEVIIFGIDHEIAKNIINDICSDVKNKIKYSDNQVSSNIVEGYDVTFLKVDKIFYKFYLGYALWFYESILDRFPVLQIIWPDSNGHYPWDKVFDKRLEELQPILNIQQRLQKKKSL